MGVLEKRIAVVTGAGSGLGRAAALAFALEGASVALLGRRRDKLEETAELLEKATGRETMPIQADITLKSDIHSAIDALLNSWGRIDVLLNNAAVLESGSVLDLATEEWEKQIATNLTGPFLLTQAVLPIMRANRYGRIINITSGLARNGAGGFAAYSAAKAGLESLTVTTAHEEHEYGILVNLYNPGTLRTEMHAVGKEPAVVTPDLVRLASLSFGGPTGALHSYG